MTSDINADMTFDINAEKKLLLFFSHLTQIKRKSIWIFFLKLCYPNQIKFLLRNFYWFFYFLKILYLIYNSNVKRSFDLILVAGHASHLFCKPSIVNKEQVSDNGGSQVAFNLEFFFLSDVIFDEIILI